MSIYVEGIGSTLFDVELSTGSIKYYILPGVWPGLDDLPGLYDRTGFLP